MSQQPIPADPASTRVGAIDALRGFDMFWIIGGGEVVTALILLIHGSVPEVVKMQMKHVPWEGFSAWDLIMPLFLFVVGAAMPFSLGKRLEAGHSRKRIYLKVLSRVLILWVLGMIAQGNLLKWEVPQLRLFSNTLQSIAVGYLVAAIALVHLPRLGQVLLTVALLGGYWAIMLLVPMPGQAAGLMEEKANLALYIDQVILGPFRNDSSYAWILPSMGFAATVMLGMHAGQVLRSKRSDWMKVVWLMLLGGVCLAAGWIMAGGPVTYFSDSGYTTPDWASGLLSRYWAVRFPIIKHLFTSSMVLWASGWSCLLLAAFYLAIDVLWFTAWAFPLTVIGMNAIAAYMLTHPIAPLRQVSDLYTKGLAQKMGPYGGPMQVAAGFALLWLFLWYMYRHKTFLRV